MKNNIWLLTRIIDAEVKTASTPGWTGFNIKIHNKATVTQDTVSYLPTINAPATEMSMVCETLNQTLGIMKALRLEEIVCVFDQALFAKAAENVWKNDKFSNIIIRLGTFHTICNLLSTIGKRFQDAGLRDLCIESGIIAEGSASGALEGCKYNRGIRLHKLVYEAMLRLAWKGFLPWLQCEHPTDCGHLEEALDTIARLHDNVS